MINLEAIAKLGSELNRPECVLSHQSGWLFCSDWTGTGGVSVVLPSGKVERILSNEGDFSVRPNGIAVESSGSFLLAHLGDEEGGIFRLHPGGALEDVLLEVHGVQLPPSNYVHIDQFHRIWVTISTQHIPRAAAYRKDISDGFIILIDEHGPRVVADNLGYTNECLVHPDGKRLFVNETFARRLICFDIHQDGSLRNKATVCEFGAGIFPDGMTFDKEGGIWVTSIISNRVIRVTEDGSQRVIIEDVNLDHLDKVEKAFQQNALDRPHLDRVCSQKLKNISSLAFGGKDLNIAYLGCLLGDHIAYFSSPWKGVAPNHWRAPLDQLLTVLHAKNSYE